MRTTKINELWKWFISDVIFPSINIYRKYSVVRYSVYFFQQLLLIFFFLSILFDYFSGRPEPIVSWFNGTEPIQTNGGVAMGRHVIVNRLEIPHLTRAAYNSTLRCQASNTKLAPPVERTVRLDMLCKWYLFIQNCIYKMCMNSKIYIPVFDYSEWNAMLESVQNK